MTTESRDLTRIVLMVLFIVALIVSSFRILEPFLLATVWASTIAVATWPLLLRVEAWLGKRRGAAVAVMLVVMLLAFMLPVGLTVESIVSHRDTISGWLTALPEMTIPAAPAWVEKLPGVGATIATAWNEIAAAGTKAIFVRLSPHTKNAFAWLMNRAGGIGTLFVQFLLTVAIAGILYAKGETAALGVVRFGRRLGGDRGERVVRLAGQSVRAVALGVIVTAVVQSFLSGVGLAVAGVPFATMLTGLVFVLCIAQLGPFLVMLPASIWLYMQGSHGWGIALFVWSIPVGLIDNVLRPLLIKRGADLPLLLIFAGVIGGLLSLGVVGLFVGPVVLAVTYTLLGQWVASEQGVSE
jgi:predicted PurR-regulated permease PerM